MTTGVANLSIAPSQNVEPAVARSGARPVMVQPVAAPSGVSVGLKRVTHRFSETIAVDNISMDIRGSELIVLLGPSGCGKTTLLRIIAGLIRQTDGNVSIGESVVDDLPPYDRGAGIVFQNYALFPHMTVSGNVAYGMRARHFKASVIKDTVGRMLELVHMKEFGARYPRELSGGQQQRAALARTLAVSPSVLLLDEPFGALDKNLRLDMQLEVKRLQRELGITTIMVTHDQEEALGMADRIAVMNKGRIEQVATPEEIYDAPAGLFVAEFIGSANFLNGTMRKTPEGFCIDLDVGGLVRVSSAQPYNREGKVRLMTRPEQLQLGRDGPDGIPAKIVMVLPLGPSTIYELSTEEGQALKVMSSRTEGANRFAIGDSVRLTLAPGAVVSIFAR
jgi:putative spermidine/putrescine transport system ATP-binding protein